VTKASDPRRELESDDESDEQDLAEQLASSSVAAVVSGTDWTTHANHRQKVPMKSRLRMRGLSGFCTQLAEALGQNTDNLAASGALASVSLGANK
jgi:hypothetical protein